MKEIDKDTIARLEAALGLPPLDPRQRFVAAVERAARVVERREAEAVAATMCRGCWVLTGDPVIFNPEADAHLRESIANEWDQTCDEARRAGECIRRNYPEALIRAVRFQEAKAADEANDPGPEVGEE